VLLSILALAGAAAARLVSRAGPQALELGVADDQLAEARIENFKHAHARPSCPVAIARAFPRPRQFSSTEAH
jgi:hypothetical protein